MNGKERKTGFSVVGFILGSESIPSVRNLFFALRKQTH
jgi:hypothetical protein